MPRHNEDVASPGLVHTAQRTGTTPNDISHQIPLSKVAQSLEAASIKSVWLSGILILFVSLLSREAGS